MILDHNVSGNQLKLVFLQYGDYGSAYRRLAEGGPETYRDQKHSVDYVASLAPDLDVTTVAICDRPHNEELSRGLKSIGLTLAEAYSAKLIETLDALSPDLMVVRTPHRRALEWIARRGLPVLPVFADIFGSNSLRERWQNYRLGAALRKCKAPAIANHSLLASRSMVQLGVPLERIVPWDWNRMEAIEPAKELSLNRPFSLFYAGILSESKGVGDVVRAVAYCRRASHSIHLTLAGAGDDAQMRRLVSELQVSDAIKFAGTISVQAVLSEMRKHDAVVVPSRHSYAEGLPNTIFEALASRSPLIASDHPAFANRLSPGVDSLRFVAGSVESLSKRILEISSDGYLYNRLSLAASNALSSLYCGIEWSKLMGLFLNDPVDLKDWVNRLSMAQMKQIDI